MSRAIAISVPSLPRDEGEDKDDHPTPQDLPRMHEVRNDSRPRDSRGHQRQSASGQALYLFAHNTPSAPNEWRPTESEASPLQ
jgi:hypothetical protein